MSNHIDQVPDHFNVLLHFDQMFDDDIKQFQDVQQKMQSRKDYLLEYRPQLVCVGCSELDAYIANIDGELRHIDENNHLIQQQVDKMNDLVKTEMIEYTKKFISSSEMTPQITEILQNHGITQFTLSNSSIINALKRRAADPPASVVQPKRPVDEPVPVVVDEPIPVPEKQEDLQVSVKACADHLRKMLIKFGQEMEKYEHDRQGLERAYEATQGFRTSTVKNKRDSFNSHLRVLKIKNQFEMIEYVKKNLTDDRLTEEILQLLGCTTHDNTTLGNRLEQFTEKLSEEYEQVLSSFQSTSTSFNFDGIFNTFVNPKTDKDADQDDDGKMEDPNGDQNNNQA